MVTLTCQLASLGGTLRSRSWECLRGDSCANWRFWVVHLGACRGSVHAVTLLYQQASLGGTLRSRSWESANGDPDVRTGVTLRIRSCECSNGDPPVPTGRLWVVHSGAVIHSMVAVIQHYPGIKPVRTLYHQTASPHRLLWMCISIQQP